MEATVHLSLMPREFLGQPGIVGLNPTIADDEAQGFVSHDPLILSVPRRDSKLNQGKWFPRASIRRPRPFNGTL